MSDRDNPNPLPKLEAINCVSTTDDLEAINCVSTTDDLEAINRVSTTQNYPLLPEMVDVWQQTLNWQPDPRQQQLFQGLYELILQGNRQLNLTRITEPIEFWEKHLWDSLRPMLPLLKDEEKIVSSCRVIDIGTGAGFPGLPVAIAFPQYKITLLDATRKKTTFLETLLTELEIQNCTTLTDRAEQLGKRSPDRASYDIALVRAVGSASDCAEYALPLLKIGGLAILYRGRWTDEEAAALQTLLERLGGTIESVESFTTPLSNSVRHCLYLRKVAPHIAIQNVKLKTK